jgi:uncharacterized repeat protein (TIGR01451 family)/LPXTG-motif cell wall-anchored protein
MKFISWIKSMPKRLSVAAIVTAAVVVPAVAFAWGPVTGRQLFTTAAPADYVTFNSITDNPVQGFEPNFMQIKDASASNSTYTDNIKVQDGKEYTVFVYYHNNASSDLNASGVGIAHGAFVRSEIPAVVNGTAQSVSYVGAANATPGQVFDNVTLTSDSALNLAMVPGSAHIYNKGLTNGMTMPDSIVTTGDPLGFDKLDGVVPGCNNYAGYVTFNVKATSSNFTVSKEVSKHGANAWTKNYTAQPGETVDYLIQYKNTGTSLQNDVALKDQLPTGETYVNGSTTFTTPLKANSKATDDITRAGINIGSYNAGGGAYAIFSATVASNDSLAVCGPNTLTNTASAIVNGTTKQDTAVVTVNKTCTTTTTVQACDTTTKQIVTINKSDLSNSKYTQDLTKCTPVVTPPQLPHTGASENILAFTGLGAMIASIVYYVRSRRLGANL